MRDERAKRGVSVVEGIGTGRAVLWRDHPSPRPTAGPLDEEQARLARGVAAAKRGLAELVRLLPRAEVELFEPELIMMDDLGAMLHARLREGDRAEDAVSDVASLAPGDLLLDARARILDAIAHDQRTVESHLEGSDGDVVLVADALTPSVVASLPSRVVAVVATTGPGPGRSQGATSHAAILARGRDIPLVFLSPEDLGGIGADELVLVDTMEPIATVTLGPSAESIQAADTRRLSWNHSRAEIEAQVASPLDHLGVDVLVNVGSLRERVPQSAEGVGLLRTELVFSDREDAPSEAEQYGTLRAIAASVPRLRVVVRLFDAGADKPLRWLPAPPGEDTLRGIALLVRHPDVLATQLRAILRAKSAGELQVLVPYVEHPEEVADVRARLRGQLAVGALVETPQGVERIDAIAQVADFISIGTNDLTACVADSDRASAGLSLDTRVLRMVARTMAAARQYCRRVTVCGEMAGDAHGARVLVGLGPHSLSVAPGRIAPIKLSLRSATLEDCQTIARAAVEPRMNG